MDCIVDTCGGNYVEGDDPPDAVLNLNDREIGVEVSCLVEQIIDAKGVSRSRMGYDQPGANLADVLNDELKDDLPNDSFVCLSVSSPINRYQKVKKKLRSIIYQQVHEGIQTQTIVLEENHISINVHTGRRQSGKKVIGIVGNRYSDKNIERTVMNVLKERISEKNVKCEAVSQESPVWLALYNTIWLADIDLYRTAFGELGMDTIFERILVIDRYRNVETIYSKSIYE